jgi:hypothetical protein
MITNEKIRKIQREIEKDLQQKKMLGLEKERSFVKTIQIEQLDRSELVELVKQSVNEALREKERTDFEKQTFNIKEAAEIIKKSDTHVRRLIRDGLLRTTADGKFVSGRELNRYLGEYNISK